MTDDFTIDEQSKQRSMDPYREHPEGQYLTTNQGGRVNHTDDSLKAGERGPTLLEDFHFREKITHFDHERIPERVVHARGSGAHGYFQVYEPLAEFTKAGFLQDPAVKTPVFVRFSTVAGSRGSADTVRDVRGFATKFYTSEGVYDLVGNNIPVFFIQDAIKFPDVIHAVKPEPDNEMPQAGTAHDTAWDFFSLVPETTHMVLWTLSDRAIPRSFRMMEGFGVNTYRFVNEQGKARFVKFHWKPVLGVHSLVWDEAQKLAGKDPDWLRRDLWESIEAGAFPEYELGVQLIDEEDEFAFAFDVLDPTKVWPEELIPVRRIGKMTLNRNPDNFFAETEQVAFCPTHIVPGIDFSDDPLLQGRLFSYLDTQLSRLGSPNFAELPINRSLPLVHNNQRDGHMRQTITPGKASYYPNSLGGGCPMTAPASAGGYVHYPEQVQGRKVRARSESFRDYFSQATLFWKSLTAPEKEHLVAAAHFELGKVNTVAIRERMVALFAHVDTELAQLVAEGIGVEVPSNLEQLGSQPPSDKRTVEHSPALSMEYTIKDTIKSRRVAILAANGVDAKHLQTVKKALEEQGAQVKVISKLAGTIKGADGTQIPVDMSSITTASIMFDAVFIPDGLESVAQLLKQGDALYFVMEAYKHAKPIAALGAGTQLLAQAHIPGLAESKTGAEVQGEGVISSNGVVTAQGKANMSHFVEQFVAAITQHRHWMRQLEMVPA
jgi:catalase